MKYNKVIIKAYYNLDGEYVSFPDNPLHGKVYENVDVKFKKEVNTIAGIEFESNVIKIEGEEPIECELVSRNKQTDGSLIIGICQDWG